MSTKIRSKEAAITRMQGRVARGIYQPMTEKEEKRIVYFFQNSELSSMTAAEKMFHRSATVIKGVLRKHNVEIRFDPR